MTFRTAIAAAGLLAFTAACSTYDVERVRDADPPGSDWETVSNESPSGTDFNAALARDYKALALFENDVMYDYSSGGMYARKSLAASNGEDVLPFELADFDLPEEHLPALQEARATIVSLWQEGVRETYPILLARVQSSFDCWVEQQEENHQPNDIAECRDHYVEALEELRLAMAPPPEPIAAAPPPPPPPTFADSFVVYFGFDSADLTNDARTVLSEVIVALQQLNAGASVIGFADTSGPADYNMTLSEARAKSVTDVLVDAGVRPAVVTSEGRGEQDLAVETEDGVREPLNRRVEINIR